MSIRPEAASGVRWTVLSSGARASFLVIRLSVLTRLLEPRDFGLMSLVTLVLGYTQTYVEMGFSNAIIQKQSSTARELSTLFWLSALAGGAVALILAALSGYVATFFKEPELRNLLLPAVFLLPIGALEQQFRALFTRELEFRKLALIEIGGEAAGLSVAIAAALSGAGAMSLVYAALVTAVLRSLVTFGLGVRRWPLELYCRPREVRFYLNFGAFQLLQYTLSYLTANLDSLLLGRYANASVLGLYTLAARLARITQRHINPVVTRVAFPAFARKHENVAAVRGGLLRIQKGLAYAALPALVGLFLTSETLVPIVYGTTGVDVAPIVQFLVWPAIFQALTGSMGAVLLSMGRVKLLFQWALGSLVAWAVVLWPAIQGGFQSFLIARSILGVVSACLFAWITLRLLELSMAASLQSIARPFLAVLCMGAAVYPMGALLCGASPIAILAIQVGAGGLVFAAIAWWLDRAFIRDTARLFFERSGRSS